MVPLVTASLPLDHDTTALGEASLTQWIATTILPSESTVVLTAGRNSTGLPGEDTVLVWSPSVVLNDILLSILNLLAVILHLFCSIGWSAMHVTVFPLRLSAAVTVRLKFPAPLLVLLNAGKESWA